MVSAISRYWDDLCSTFGGAWNQFWFRPSDPLVLCWLRILSGLMSIYWVISYTADIDRLFGPGGMLPIELIDQLRGNSWTSFSYLDYLHTSGELKTAHYVGLAVLVLFTVGAFTRITSVLALIVVLSYIHRAPVLTSQVEPILTMVLFYLCLGPAGSYLSVDRFRQRHRAAGESAANAAMILAVPPSTAATIAVRLIQVHLCVAYLMMGLAKLSGPNQVWWMGDAVWWLVARPDTRLVDLTELLARHPYIVNAWTHAIPAFELAFPILIWYRLARPLLLALAVPMWLSLAVITGLAPFCLMMLIASLAFVPSCALRCRACAA